MVLRHTSVRPCAFTVYVVLDSWWSRSKPSAVRVRRPLQKERTSEAFQKAFYEADVILSKGQGNFESLSGVKKENLFFLFTAKCDTVCAEAGVPKLSIVCMENPVLNTI